LGSYISDKRGLEWVQVFPYGQTLDGRNSSVMRLEGQVATGTDGLAIHQDSTSATHLGLTGTLGAGQSDPVSQEV